MGATGEGGRDGSVGNSIASGTFSGPVVQARDVHVHMPPKESLPVPRQLLPVPHHFTDRAEELHALNGLLASEDDPQTGPPLIVVNGPAGIGKTALVSRWLRTQEAAFPDGQLYADLYGHAAEGPADPAEVLGQFLRSLGVAAPPAGLAEQASLWRSVTAGLRVAVMLDSAYTAAQIRPLLPGGSGALVVVTSRQRLTGLRLDGAAFFRLDALDAAAGLELLTRGVGEARVAGERSAVEQVVQLCAGVPLAVCLAAARLAARPRQPIAALADSLAPDADRLAALEVEGEITVSKALDASYAVLDQRAARLYRMLGTLPVPTFDTRTAAAGCAESEQWAERRLDELIEANLVEDIGPDTFRFHDLVRVHARSCAETHDGEDARTEALRRVADWYLRTTTAAEQLITPAQFTLPRTYAHPTPLPAPFEAEKGALDWLDAHRHHLMALLRTAAGRAWHATAWQLVDAMWPLFLRLRYYDLWAEAHTIGLAAARADKHPEAERQMLNSGAIGLSAAGRVEEAADWYTQSLAAARAAGDVRDEGQARLGLGSCRMATGRLDEAVRHLDLAVRIWEECGYRRGVALAGILLGETALRRDDPVTAIPLFEEARRILIEVADPHDATRALAFLGRAHAQGGERTLGTDELTEALEAFRASGALHWQARTLEMLGRGAREQGAETEAAEYLAEARSLYEVTSPADARRLE
ncbi:tetratricopeptide repeat protein [Streptomyces sp. WP-1]|uniref:tetratricopeptide repeat protein n=1 Tax=Streptomyces sp. WP-1 TaxID=3041497 RepID=UPI002648DBB7|nr:tetratricopeptide repeat protein [Streptomyces sp. WP-1]WKE68565.1 tetratricopeptide repeat protein [Streptomyces sp. WP-1]